MQQLAGRVLVAVEFSSHAAVKAEAHLINPLLHFQAKDLSTVAH